MTAPLCSKAVALIKSFEKCKLTAYREKGDRWTIGWGNTYYEDGTPVKQGDVITQQRADQLFGLILLRTTTQVDSLVRSVITANQRGALVSFAYNVGADIDADTIAEGLGDSTLLKLVNANPSNPAIRAEFAKWISKGTQFENGLRRRRAAEADLYFSA